MIYITDNFSIQIFKNTTYTLKTQTIKKRKLIENTKEAITSLSSPKIACMLGKNVGKTDIKPKHSDAIYSITSNFGRKKSGYKKEKKYRYQEFIIE